MIILIGATEAVFVWMTAFAKFEGPRSILWLAFAVVSAILISGLLHILATFRVRLDESGVWPNRRGHPSFVPWEGALLGARGSVLLLRNGSLKTEINIAVFANRQAFMAFLAHKFPPPAGDKQP